eukprot:CAMPEP_0205812100 /NCGR_PEP_ID=MMETSP0205-20121125/16453_1 /ASSEMBLY_ACC=CAM_ASM_000278 /TAXON_ID=36767 /ORGANISM="Euplotes focardii, Strain TN1" /LENGTH=76 /DNA_ID=CAMNT_0053092239 /DNA_START=432 /DNA_END=662 /DNA_ORIENTATION=-
MAETLFKIKTGNLDKDFIPQTEDPEYEFTEFDPYKTDYQDFVEEGDYYEEDEYDFYESEAALSKRNKPNRMKNKKK